MHTQSQTPTRAGAWILSPRALDIAGRCPRRYAIEFEDGLRRAPGRRAPAGANLRDALHFGWLARRLALHEGDDPVRAAQIDAIQWWETAVRSTRAGMTMRQVDAEEEELRSVREEARIILKHYGRRYDATDATLGRQCTRDGRPASSSVACARLGGGATLRGRFGAIYPRPGRGAVLHRPFFAATGQPTAIEADLRADLRTGGVIWLAERWSRRRVDAVVWDVIRTKAPGQPAPLQCRSCKGGGRTAAGDPCPLCAGTGVSGMSRAPCDTTCEQWEATLSRWPHLDPVIERELAAPLLARLTERGDTFMYRIEVPVPERTADRWRQDARDLLGDLRRYRRRGRWATRPGACRGRGGPCPYRAICAGLDPTLMLTRVPDPANHEEATLWQHRTK